ncbi:MAG TPA: Rne/Rng family ribonuclease [Polyangiaceae bacterium]|nr:Rne/Rng family ribonuclease [Polyangiaceae bacterium]
MAKNILVISCDIAETRVALIENGIIAELHIERRGATPRGGTVGDVYLGRVTRVLPGLQAAFVDIGLERAAFLHVEDLIRPDDFETYLAGGRKHALGSGDDNKDAPPDENVREPAVASVQAAAEEALAAVAGDEADAGAEDGALEPEEDAVRTAKRVAEETAAIEKAAVAILDEAAQAAASEVEAAAETERDEDEDDEPADDAAAGSGPSVAEAAAASNDGRHAPEDSVRQPVDIPGELTTSRGLDDPDSEPPPPLAAEDLDDLLDNPNLPGFTVSDPGTPVAMPRAPAPRLEERRDGRGGDKWRRGRGRGDRGGGGGGGGGGGRQQGRGRGGGGGGGGGGDHGRDNRGPRQGGVPGRLSKSTPIRDVVKEGQDIIVQITKEPIGTKGARCSSHVSLPGRYVVYLPTLEHVGVSKRIGSDKERARLRETIESMKPPAGGLIVRTVAEGLTKKQLKQDVGYLVRLWGEVAKKREGARSPATLLSELDIVLKTARDLFTDEVDQLVIDDRAQYDRLYRFVEMFMPERLKDIVYYNDDEPIFDAYGIEDEIARALSRKVPLPSGGYLIIDEAEALTAVDVNTGRFVGKGSKDMEETILKTNLEAVHEIAYQLRFRNIGGLIILDLIDMEKASNREKVRKTLEELLQKDKAKTTLNRISELGLIEMTRKRTRESLGRLMHEPCFYCDGTGHLMSKETVCFDILREIRRKRQDLPGYSILVNCHPAVADLLTGSEKAAVQDAESRFMRRIQVTARTEYHLEQFDLSGH